MAYLVSNICTKNYWNRTTIVEIIVGGWVYSKHRLLVVQITVAHFWTTVCKTVCPMRSDHCLSCPVCPVLSICDVRALWPNGWTDQDETWHAGRPRPWPHCVRWGPSSPSPKGAQPPNFRPISVAAKWQHVTCSGARPRPRRLCVRWGPRSALPKRGAEHGPPKFLRPMFIAAKRLEG